MPDTKKPISGSIFLRFWHNAPRNERIKEGHVQALERLYGFKVDIADGVASMTHTVHDDTRYGLSIDMGDASEADARLHLASVAVYSIQLGTGITRDRVFELLEAA